MNMPGGMKMPKEVKPMNGAKMYDGSKADKAYDKAHKIVEDSPQDVKLDNAGQRKLNKEAKKKRK